MSPTIPPVLVLSLLLVPPLPATEAGELMDLFALIRGTLKYWRRIYQMYEEEVALGFCWAEYFLHRGEDTNNKPMSPPVFMEPANTVPVQDGGFGKLVMEDTFGREVWKDWVTSMDGAQGYRRSKRSYRTLNSTEAEKIRGTSGKNFDAFLETLEKLACNSTELNLDSEGTKNDVLETDIGFPKNMQEKLVVSVRNNRGCDSDEHFLKTINSTMEEGIFKVSKEDMIVSDEWRNSEITDTELESNKKYGDNKSLCEKVNCTKGIVRDISKASEEIPKASEGKIFILVAEPMISDLRSKTGEVEFELNKRDPNSGVSEDEDSAKYGRFPRNLQEDWLAHRNRRSSGTSNSAYADIEEISKILVNCSIQESTTSNIPSKTDKIKFKSNQASWSSKSKNIDSLKGRIKDTRKNGPILVDKRSFEISNFIKPDRNETSNIKKSVLAKTDEQRLSIEKLSHNVDSEATKVKLRPNGPKIPVDLDSKPINSLCRKALWSSVDEVGGSPFLVPSSSAVEQRVNQKDRLFPTKGGNTAEIDEKFKRSQAEVDPGEESKNLQVDTRRKLLYPKTSVTSGTPSRLELPERQGSRSFSLGTVASLNSIFKDSWTSQKIEDNTESSDFLRRKKYGSSNLGFQRVEQRPESFRRNCRGNLRRKRDANDRIRSQLVRPLSKTGRASSNNPTSLDEIQRFSSGYTAPRIESGSISSRNDEETFKRNVERLSTTRNESSRKIPLYYLKQYRNVFPMIHEPTLEASPVALEGIRSASSRPIDVDSRTFGASSSHVFLEDQSKHGNPKWKNNWDEGSNSKQLRTTKDNRYRKTEHTFLVEKPTAEGMGKKSTIRHLVGPPSLLPVSYPRFMGDYGSSTSGTARNSSPSRSSRAKDQGRRSSRTKVEARGPRSEFETLFYLRQAFMGFLRTLGFFVNVGRQLIDYVDSNSALACTKDYLVGKAIHWIDS